MDLVRIKGTDCNIDLNSHHPENQTVGLQGTGETGVGRISEGALGWKDSTIYREAGRLERSPGD